MWNWIKKEFNDFLVSSSNDWESMKRGTYAGWIPLAIMAASALAKGIANKKAGDAKGKEEKRVGEANAQANYESQLANEANLEDKRLYQTEGIGSQLTGARALSPKVLAAALKRRASAVRKGATIDPTKGSGWGMIGDMAGQAGQIAATYQGQTDGPSAGGAQATSLRPAIGGSRAEDCPGGPGYGC